MIRRREFLGLAGVAAVYPRMALAQQANAPHVAWLSPMNPGAQLQALLDGLADSGYLDGKTLIVDQFTPPTVLELPASAAKLVANHPAVIVTYGTPATLAVKAVTNTIPIVFAGVTDPVGVDLVPNLAHP